MKTEPNQGLALLALSCVVFVTPAPASAQDVPEQASGESHILKVDQGGKTIELPYVISDDGLAVVEGDIVIGMGQDLLAVSQPKTLQSIGNANH